MANGSFENLLEVVSEKPHQLEVFAVTAWFLWMRRNKLRLKEDVIPLNRVVLEAKRFLSLHNPGRTPKLKLPRPTTVNWRPPDRCEYKTNFDGAMFSDTGEAGIGVVIRNRDGEVMAALSEKIPQPASVTMLELLAARRFAIFIHEVGLRNSVLEGDSETVIKALQNGDKFQTAFGHICRDTLLKSIPHIVDALASFSYSPRFSVLRQIEKERDWIWGFELILNPLKLILFFSLSKNSASTQQIDPLPISFFFCSISVLDFQVKFLEQCISSCYYAGNVGLKNDSINQTQAASECSDDEASSIASREEGLECPICWESFNIVENVPYVLWCGHTLCKNCILGLQWAVVKFPTLPIQLPLFISCPWCNLLSFRLVYRGNLKFPRKNYFLLWMVESMHGDRVKSHSSFARDQQSLWPTNGNLPMGGQVSNGNLRRGQYIRHPEPSGSHHDRGHLSNYLSVETLHSSLRKSLIFFVHLTAKFPLVVIFLLIVLYAIPASAAILALYILVTVLFALPSFLVLYFAYPSLDWLVREIIT